MGAPMPPAYLVDIYIQWRFTVGSWLCEGFEGLFFEEGN